MKMVQISDLNGDRIQAFGKILFISRDEEGELCFRLNSKEIHFLDEIRESGKVLTADLESRVDQNICDVIVTGAKTAQKTEESVITVDRILFCIEQSCLMCDIVSQLRAFFDDNNIAVRRLNCFICKVDELFCFTRAFFANNKCYHCICLLNNCIPTNRKYFYNKFYNKTAKMSMYFVFLLKLF